jgi:phage-related minor tail protein
VSGLDAGGTPASGVTLAPGSGSWSSLSDRNAKKDFRDVDGDAILVKLASMPIYTWRYKAEASGALHMGPTAQDFRAAFGLGDSDKRIATIDAEGVALAASQALHRQLKRQENALAEQEHDLSELERRLAQLESFEQARHRARSHDRARQRSVRTTLVRAQR